MYTSRDRISNTLPVLRLGPELVVDVDEVQRKLEDGKTLDMVPNGHGIYPASSGHSPSAEHGMGRNAWIRDLVMVIHSLEVRGLLPQARTCLHSLLLYALTQVARFEAVIAHPKREHDIQCRPHVRFDADTLSATDQPWGHHQLDAWGYLLWITATLGLRKDVELSQDEEELLAVVVKYLDATNYASDPNNGTWEEDPDVKSSSIAACIAGLRAVRQYARARASAALAHVLPRIDALIQAGGAVLTANLPFETPPHRNADAALLFAIYPLRVIEDPYQQDLLLSLIQARLLGPYGIRRYNGDSYYCQDYDKWFNPRQRSNDNTLSVAMRNQFLTPGFEAQWCIFDPIVSVIYGERYHHSGDHADFNRQLRFANRSLGQITADLKCPEMYFCSEGTWIPNPHTPLLWTQANLAVAMKVLGDSAMRYERGFRQPQTEGANA
jgi:phosphorylase kinase alpha/beta subunit